MSGKDEKREVTLGLIQMKMDPDVEKNLEKGLLMIDEAAGKGAQIVCLPELFQSLYFCQDDNPENFKLAEEIPGKATEALSRAARKNKVVVVAGLFERAAKGVYYNSAAVIDADGSLLGKYRKIHIPEDPTDYMENLYFAPGDLGFKSFDTAYGKVGVLICWDQWFPEAARITALAGAEIIFYPTAIGWLPSAPDSLNRTELSAWKTIQRAHGIANGVFVAAVNRVGREKNIDFWGSSFVSGPFGETIAEIGPEKEGAVIARCDLNYAKTTREVWPFLRKRRVDAYKGITSKFQ
jgi:N-carbamoylputrescine amidase